MGSTGKPHSPKSTARFNLRAFMPPLKKPTRKWRTCTTISMDSPSLDCSSSPFKGLGESPTHQGHSPKENHRCLPDAEEKVVCDFTYIDNIVKGCLGTLNMAEKSTDGGGNKRGLA
ncbi:hypothetical protein RJT34_03675 [Clitoria ternatea]|uniref:Uncharacterized protein n=1 Tax=Clitoria ternatea TaxID=43366 RepID=A0AAN9Q1G8_CLITE